jgi:ferrous iron transport protein A
MSPLSDLPLGARGRIAEIRGGRQLAHRLQGLGLRVGSEVEMLHRRGGGVVVSVGATRVALGGGVVEKLFIDPLDRPSEDGSDAGPQDLERG